MVIIKVLFLLALILFDASLGVLYYAPHCLPFGFLDYAKSVIHATRQSQDITFVIFYAFVTITAVLFVLMVTAKKRKLSRRRKKLTKMFDQYGAKYSAEDKEINF